MLLSIQCWPQMLCFPEFAIALGAQLCSTVDTLIESDRNRLLAFLFFLLLLLFLAKSTLEVKREYWVTGSLNICFVCMKRTAS